MDWSTTAMLVGVLSPMVGVPLTAITLYLRAIREHQATGAATLLRRIESIETTIRDLTRSMTGIERDYTPRQEWLRESADARRQLERLTEMVTRVQAGLEDGGAMAAELAQAVRAVVALAERCAAKE